MKKLLLLALLWIAAAPRARADVRLPAILGSHMVVQQGQPFRFWGWADPGEKITIKIGDQEVGATVGQGKVPWSITIPPLPAGAVSDITVQGKNRVILTDVLSGDVWLCSGQSNMAWTLEKSTDGAAEVAAAHHPEIRLFHVLELASPPAQRGALDYCRGEWVVCSPETAAKFSGVAYFFGRELQQKLNRPIGLIESSVGGTPIEYWMDGPSLNGDPAFDPKEGYAAEYPLRLKIYRQYLAGWQKKADAASAAHQPVPPPPQVPPTPEQVYAKFSSLYDTLIHPLIPFRLKGVLWYQGETNAQRAFQYRHLLAAMIAHWRGDWGQDDLPFIVVQIANYEAGYLQPGAWAELREAQARVAQEVPHCGLVVTLDTGDPKGNNLHPPDKQDVGKRCALSALKLAYGQQIVASGPTCESVRFDDNQAIVKLAHLGGGLMTQDGQPPQGFTLAGEDRHFYPANAVIQNDRVVVTSAQVAKPVAVRYGWADNPHCTLYNKEALPAVPFRSDHWPEVTGPHAARDGAD